MEISFRPHHFLCALCFRGKGYSADFITNFKSIMRTLNSDAGDETQIHITAYTDSICAPCPNRTGKTCLSEEKINTLDAAHAKALNIKPDETITWGKAKDRITEKISLSTFHQICAHCDWKQYGICEKVLNEFLK